MLTVTFYRNDGIILPKLYVLSSVYLALFFSSSLKTGLYVNVIFVQGVYAAATKCEKVSSSLQRNDYDIDANRSYM